MNSFLERKPLSLRLSREAFFSSSWKRRRFAILRHHGLRLLLHQICLLTACLETITSCHSLLRLVRITRWFRIHLSKDRQGWTLKLLRNLLVIATTKEEIVQRRWSLRAKDSVDADCARWAALSPTPTSWLVRLERPISLFLDSAGKTLLGLLLIIISQLGCANQQFLFWLLPLTPVDSHVLNTL